MGEQTIFNQSLTTKMCISTKCLWTAFGRNVFLLDTTTELLQFVAVSRMANVNIHLYPLVTIVPQAYLLHTLAKHGKTPLNQNAKTLNISQGWFFAATRTCLANESVEE